MLKCSLVITVMTSLGRNVDVMSESLVGNIGAQMLLPWVQLIHPFFCLASQELLRLGNILSTRQIQNAKAKQSWVCDVYTKLLHVLSVGYVILE